MVSRRRETPVAATVARLGVSGSSLLEGVLVRDLERRLGWEREVWEAARDVCCADLERVMRMEAVVLVVGVGEELEERSADSGSSEISSSFLFGDGIAPGRTGAFFRPVVPGFDGDVKMYCFRLPLNEGDGIPSTSSPWIADIAHNGKKSYTFEENDGRGQSRKTMKN